MPHGVTPPAQLAKVPVTARPVGSAAVLTKSVPAAGTGEGERGVGGDAAVVATHHRSQTAARGALDLDDGQAERGDLDVELIAGGRVGLIAGEHELRTGVLVVGDQQEAVRLPVYRHQRGEVVVEAELPALRGGGLVADVELRRVG